MGNKIAILAVAFAIVALSQPAYAQQAKEMPLVGVLQKRGFVGPNSIIAAFRQGLRDLGYVEGRNIKIIYGNAKGKRDLFPGLVADMLRLKVDVIVSSGGAPVRAAMKATRTIPIVVAVASDFISQGYAKSLRRPGGNVTGLSTMAQVLMGKQLQLFKEVIPTLSRVAILRSPTGPHDVSVRQAEVAAPVLGLGLVVIKVGGAADLPGAFRRIAAARAGAVLVLRSGYFIRLNRQIVARARKAGLPTMFGHVREAAGGGLLAYGADTKAMYRGAAYYVDKILKGANPAEMPVSQATKFNLTVNLRTAKALGITFPQSILLRADKVIE